MKKTYLEPETKLYAMCVEGYLLDNTITAGTKDPDEGGSPVTGGSNPSNPSNPFDPFDHSSSPAKEEITWSFDD